MTRDHPMTFQMRIWLVFGMLAAAGFLFPGAIGAESNGPDSIRSSGGKFFATAIELPVRPFAQNDPRWAGDFLGPTKETLADQGCTLTSVVMILNYYGIETDPARFNRYLAAHSGYDDEGYLSFDCVGDFARKTLRLAYQGRCSYESLDRNLLAGNPIIVQMSLPDGGMHFVVVAGKRGFDYRVYDPADYPGRPMVSLSSIALRIEREYLFVARNLATGAP